MAQILTKIKKVSTSLGHKNEYDNLEDNLLETSLLENDKIVLPVLKEIIRKYTDKSIWEALDYSLINKSHFDRAFFVRLGCEAVGGDFKSILPALASVELRYASGTAIDDVFDYNSERMGKPSMPKLYGNNLALCYGAILKSISSVSLLSLYNSNRVDLKSFIEINIKDEFTHYQVYLGQVSDILSEKLSIEEITDDFYLDMIKNATGVDAGYCFELGCLLGGGSIEQQKYFYEFGVSLGTAMQLRDDLLDYVNDKDLINKEPFRDFETNKKRLPIILAYRLGTQSEKELIRNLFNKEKLSDEEKSSLSSIVSNELVLAYLENLNTKLIETAKNSFEKTNSSKQVQEIVTQIFKQIDV